MPSPLGTRCVALYSFSLQEDCETEYENQECVAPDTCGCTEGWSMDESGVCNMPECSNCFVNDECLAPGDCTCIEGWTRSASGHCDKVFFGFVGSRFF